jgi:predicted kinase
VSGLCASGRLYLVRGLPGAGKSALARDISLGIAVAGNIVHGLGEPHCHHIEADRFFIGKDGVYRFAPSKIQEAHAACQAEVRQRMAEEHKTCVVVSNTFTRKWEMAPYYDMANEFAYTVRVVTVEDPDATDEDLAARNVHGVPVDVIRGMRARWEAL